MPTISVTREVFQLDTSKEVREEQPLNIKTILVTREIFQLDTSKEVKEEQI